MAIRKITELKKEDIENFKQFLINWFAYYNSYHKYNLNGKVYYTSVNSDEDMQEDEFFNYIVDMFEIDEVTKEDFNEFLKELKF